MPTLLAEIVDGSAVYIPTLDGITAIIAGFFFYCLAKPAMIRNRTQYWATFVIIIAITLLYMLRMMFYNSPSAQVVTGIIIALLQVLGMVMTVMYVGGLSARELGEELKEAAVDFRTRGEHKKPVIVPLTGERPKPLDEDDDPPPRINIDLPKIRREDI